MLHKGGWCQVPAHQSAKQTDDGEEEEEGDPEYLPIIQGLLDGELAELLKAESEGCVVHYCMQKVVRLVSVRHKQGGLAAPPPIVSRIFQELSIDICCLDTLPNSK